MFLSNGDSNEELLQTMPLHGKTTGEHVFKNFYASLLGMNAPIHKLVSVATDGCSYDLT